MTVNMEDYKKEDIKDQRSRGFVDGIEEAAEELECAKENYLENLELPSETLSKIVCEIVEEFVAFARQYILDDRDSAIVAFLDDQSRDEGDD